jgi:hypothetical protein
MIDLGGRFIAKYLASQKRYQVMFCYVPKEAGCCSTQTNPAIYLKAKYVLLIYVQLLYTELFKEYLF